MLAFAESGRKEDLIALLDLLDLMKVSGSKYISNIFKSLGRLELENYADKLLQGMRSKGNKLSAGFLHLAHISLYVNKMDTSTQVILAENLFTEVAFSLPLNSAEPFLSSLLWFALRLFCFFVSKSSIC
jgi:hypothetical protein